MSERPISKTAVVTLFDRVAEGYDGPALRLYPFSADRLVHHLAPRPGEKVLDVACGTGAVALAAAQSVLPGGRVIAIDLSERMLDRAELHRGKMALDNIDLFDMDATRPEFRADYFDRVACNLGLSYLPEPVEALRAWAWVTRPGGSIVFSTLGGQALEPLRDRLLGALQAVGGKPTPAWVGPRLETPEQCLAAARAAGLQEAEVIREQLGYHLPHKEDWWEFVCNSDLRALIAGLSDSQLAQLRSRHFAELDALMGEHGLWLDGEVLFCRARAG